MIPNSNNVSEKLFKIIKGNNHPLVLFDEDGKKTVDPSEAIRLYATDIKMMVNLMLNDSVSEIVVNLSNNTDIKSLKPMLDSIRTLATTNLMEYTVKTFGKTITPKDFAYQAKRNVNEDVADDQCEFCGSKDNVNDCYQCSSQYCDSCEDLNDGCPHCGTKGKQMKINTPMSEGFSGWHGSAKKSMNDLDNARIVVRHHKKVDEEKRGARTRQVESIFIENSDGERFKFPSKNLTAAKAMLRHVKEGGNPFDTFGQHIYETMDELNELKKFQRHNKRDNFFEDKNIVNEINDRVSNLRKTLTQMSGPRGYNMHVENFNSATTRTSTPEQLDELKNNSIKLGFDESISNSLPYVAYIIEAFRTRQEKEKEIMDFAGYVLQHKNDIALSSPLNNDDPDSPANTAFKDAATFVAQWVNYLAPKMKDDTLSNKMMMLADTVYEVGAQHLKMAAVAIKVINQNASFNEEVEQAVSIEDEQNNNISESFKKYDINEIFK